MDYFKYYNNFYKSFKGEKGQIGKTYKGKEIYYFAVKKTDFPKIIVQYSIHAREYITTYLCYRQIEDFIKLGKRGTVYFIPCTNLDGVEICLTNKPLYKANARGVDLNVNFDANWGQGSQNVKVKGDSNFIGPFAFSEKETIALRDFTLKISPHATISYHSKGEEIYYQFFQNEKDEKRDYKLAKQIAKITGYKVKLTPNSAGGYKDWCIQKLHIPSFTIEVGKDSLSHPIKKKHLKDIYKKNKSVIILLSEILWKKSIWKLP